MASLLKSRNRPAGHVIRAANLGKRFAVAVAALGDIDQLEGHVKVWILVMGVYAAPPNSLDWDGPWEFGMSRAPEQVFKSEAECRNSAIELIAKLHQGMLAPMRFQCVPFAATLPKGAPR
jgi:hypothetical protein